MKRIVVAGAVAVLATSALAVAHAVVMAPVDDRGFTQLENGDQHGHSFTQPISKDDRVELAHQLVLARETALKYPTVTDAEAAGFHRIGPFAPGLGAHYVSYDNAMGDADGVLTDDDIQNPLALIYDGTHPESHIAGLFYQTPVENPVGFAGPNDTWHVHHNLCLVANPDGGMDTPLGADQDVDKAQCDAIKGTLLEQTQYLLHVWVVPGYESPEGVFSHLSSTMTCDDGTYYMKSYDMTEGVADIGTSSTVCKDGSE